MVTKMALVTRGNQHPKGYHIRRGEHAQGCQAPRRRATPPEEHSKNMSTQAPSTEIQISTQATSTKSRRLLWAGRVVSALAAVKQLADPVRYGT